VIAWNELEQTCIKLLNDPTLRYSRKMKNEKHHMHCASCFPAVKLYDFWTNKMLWIRLRIETNADPQRW
jgi:hypothetical protein